MTRHAPHTYADCPEPQHHHKKEHWKKGSPTLLRAAINILKMIDDGDLTTFEIEELRQAIKNKQAK